MKLTAVTWNIAAINNNPFEYWLGAHPDTAYEQLMLGVEGFISEPGDHDVPVSSVFSEAMWAELKQMMTAQGWTGIEETEQRWHDDFSQRRIISQFICDKSLGDKRLASMPDRVTNTIGTKDARDVFRPTLVSNFAGDMTSVTTWWAAWKRFMFEEALSVGKEGESKLPCNMLFKISKAKYPEITEAEEAISIPLQLLSIAIFDAILLHMVITVSPDGAWSKLKEGIVSALLATKRSKTVAILENQYADADLCFVQEADPAFADCAEVALKSKYTLLRPKKLSKAQQNSLLLIRNAVFDPLSVVDCSAEVMGSLGGQPVSDGDVLAVCVDGVDGKKYLLASFHGDTNGLASPTVLEALHAFAVTKPDRTPIFGMDANTHKKASKKTQGFDEFVKLFTDLGYTSCWVGTDLCSSNYTTFNARTYLQAQLQKAVKSTEIHSETPSGFIDKNPKDFILFPKATYAAGSTSKDNTGHGKFIDKVVFPTLDFPSDHVVVSTVLTPN
eukprot:CAMPEP_0183337518 /NCGR_PEP_ID=MMETSP0164_2-20130417/5127_1 /TAXON_ID=221442 /ORGANISM="Coccolithus pelagicus ssp braarudi, Strain PLY182g" /LENGTH=500 /DNA_ID=CAMNT_0025507217 /DNA_START=41 /DNA_END=1543 /DNA_ORIENTATION=+